MQYAQLNEDGSYGHQITTSGNVQWDETNYCLASALMKDGKAEQFRVVELHIIDAPAIDEMIETVVRDGGEFVEGRWQYKWRVDTLTQEEADATLARKNLLTKAALIKAAEEEFEANVSALEAAYIPKVRETWPQQIMEAKDFQINSEAPTPLLDGMLTEKPGATKEALANKILENYAAYSDMAGKALGKMQTTIDAINGE